MRLSVTSKASRSSRRRTSRWTSARCSRTSLRRRTPARRRRSTSTSSRERVTNLAGMKVSDSPWEAFAPYLLEGLEVFVGPEALIAQGLAHGAAGAVSALASALPEKVVAVDPGLADIREAIERFPRHAALKRIAARRGVPIREDVRAPLRGLTADERKELDAWLDGELS